MHGLHVCLDSWQVQVLSLNDPWRVLYDLHCLKNVFPDETFDDRIADFEFFRCSLLDYPAILFLERLDSVISTQAGNARSIPVLLLSDLLSETIQNRSNDFIRTYFV